MSSDVLPDRAKKGRGAVTNRPGRFEPHARARTADGWEVAGAEDDEPSPRTTVTVERARAIITRNDSPDIPFDRSINPYRGCEHGCVYCYARPTHAYLGLSPGLDFETKLFAKPEAAELLKRELARKGYSPAMIAMGTNTDPYQPIEKRLGITRAILQVLADCGHPVGITTKSALVLRDLDILGPMAAKGLARVAVSVTTLDAVLARKMEPRAATPARRLGAIEGLAAAGVPAMVMAAPMIPGLNDAELERILEAARDAGASGAGYVLLRLPLEIKDLFGEWLAEHYPDRAARIEALVRETRGGKLYDAGFKTRMRGTGIYAQLLAERFRLACRKLGLVTPREPLRTDLFRPPGDAAQFRLAL
ncbi:MAG: PA0069 family radical SAM protein [Alphaproteobacteria bacterium]|nr:PA0069 family radical SAM protein [Alphaproteobacteria bacterium]